MTDPDRSPFRRFPYGPALLCAACLAMCGYTWMRYSYAWGFTIGELKQYRMVDGDWQWPHGAYVELRPKDALASGEVSTYAPRSPANPHLSLSLVWTAFHESGKREDVVYIGSMGHPSEPYRGRFFFNENLRRPRGQWFGQVSLRMSRFHPASVAGLVVAAMGCFIFGLYLRMWLKERRVGG